MDNKEAQDTGVVSAILRRMETQRLPRALELKERVDRGERLEESDIGFLDKILSDCHDFKPLLARHPEYQELAARVMRLYEEITARALENETRV